MFADDAGGESDEHTWSKHRYFSKMPSIKYDVIRLNGMRNRLLD